MRKLHFAIVVAMAMALGCQPQSKSKEDFNNPDAGDQGVGVEVEAPGVDVHVAPGKGVEVEAPSVDVKAQRDEKGGEVNVDVGELK